MSKPTTSHSESVHGSPPDGEEALEPTREPARDADRELPPELEAIADRVPGPDPIGEALPDGLALARVISVTAEGVDVRVGDRFARAELDGALDPVVLRTALERGEPVLVERLAGRVTIVGALRVQATPGVDKMREIHLEAETIHLTGKKEVVVKSGLAAMAVRAVGEIETYAERIVSRAEGVHKIIGRMLRLN
jgi:hypothetical protein